LHSGGRGVHPYVCAMGCGSLPRTGVVLQMDGPDVVQAVRDSFARQSLLATLGAELAEVSDGEVAIRLPFGQHLCQQHGFAHAGAIAAIADSACGYACLTRMPAGSAVLSVEFKINLLAPAEGSSFIARGRVVRMGRSLGVATAEVHSYGGSGEGKCIAVMQATMMRVEPRAGASG
jgi:uncharacterized protein (TIGR00369 family)